MAAFFDSDDPSIALDPAALVSDDAAAEQIRRISPISTSVRNLGHGAVLAPMLPAPFINPAVIHRTAYALGARPFRYREGIVFDGLGAMLPLRYAIAGSLSAVQAAMARSARTRPSVRRRIASGLARLLPSSGFGPEESRLEGWRWRMVVDARTSGGRHVSVDVDGEGHPGYLATARMIGEAGLLLAEEGATPEGAGCLTPALALGTDCIDRFSQARLHFSLSG
jgi:short subunit dehydrogenase-like uncharacterized protein